MSPSHTEAAPDSARQHEETSNMQREPQEIPINISATHRCNVDLLMDMHTDGGRQTGRTYTGRRCARALSSSSVLSESKDSWDERWRCVEELNQTCDAHVVVCNDCSYGKFTFISQMWPQTEMLDWLYESFHRVEKNRQTFLYKTMAAVHVKEYIYIYI